MAERETVQLMHSRVCTVSYTAACMVVCVANMAMIAMLIPPSSYTLGNIDIMTDIITADIS